jgi:hypothetical protein
MGQRNDQIAQESQEMGKSGVRSLSSIAVDSFKDRTPRPAVDWGFFAGF